MARCLNEATSRGSLARSKRSPKKVGVHVILRARLLRGERSAGVEVRVHPRRAARCRGGL